MHLIFAICLGVSGIQLVSREGGFVVVEERDEKVQFNDPILEKVMIDDGVVIPPEAQERYGGRERVLLGEPQFFEAFQEFYSPYMFDDNRYQWKSI